MRSIDNVGSKDTAPNIYLHIFRENKTHYYMKIYILASQKENNDVSIAVTKNINISHKLINQNSIYTAFGHVKNFSFQDFNIFTDSLSTIYSIQNNFHLNDIAMTIFSSLMQRSPF